MDLTSQQRDAIRTQIAEARQAQADFVSAANERIAHFNGQIAALERLLKPVEKTKAEEKI